MRTLKRERLKLPIDPARPLPMVCGRRPVGDPAYFALAEYHGQRVYFCTDACLNEFLLDPDGFIRAHNHWREKSIKP